ncbi:hypothetical protein D9Q98_001733 [Chlorella vulgaris]|uniref:Uncharacterized protein n=1 Tax=Chlorella vulgaris TaxID=3077 RepID=A0A9D4Z001_CHLVU|nr:hypothetical protein D9Q98_001733 [Chlorella vulgaris]
MFLRQRQAVETGQRRCAPPAGWSTTLVKRLRLDRQLAGHDGCVNTVHFSPDGQLLVSGSDDMQIIFWDWQLGTRALEFHSGHRNNVFQARVMPQSANGTVVTCAADGMVRVAAIPQGCGGAAVETRRLACHRGRAHRLSLEPGSPHCFLSCGEDGDVRAFDLRQPAAANRRLLACRTQHGRLELNTVHCHPGSTQFCVAGGDPVVRVYDLRRVPPSGDPVAEPLRRLTPRHLRTRSAITITSAVFNQQGQILASFNDEHIYLFASEQAAAAAAQAEATSGGAKPRRPPGTAAAGPAPSSQQRRADDGSFGQGAKRRRSSGGAAGQRARAGGISGPAGSEDEGENRQAAEAAAARARMRSQQRRAAAALALGQVQRQRAPAAVAARAHASLRQRLLVQEEEGQAEEQDESIAGVEGQDSGGRTALAASRPISSQQAVGDAAWIARLAPAAAGNTPLGASVSLGQRQSDGQQQGDGTQEVSGAVGSSSSSGQDGEGEEGAGEEELMWVEAPQGAVVDVDDDDDDDEEEEGAGLRRQQPREAGHGGEVQPGWPSDDVLQSYKGHRNYRTVKGVSFLGAQEEFVMSGSDCGHIFVWCAASGRVVAMLRGDDDTVNCLEPHPHHLLTVATSGIDDTVKLWTPTAEEPQVLGAAAERQMAANLHGQGSAAAPRMVIGPDVLAMLLRAPQMIFNEDSSDGEQGLESDEDEDSRDSHGEEEEDGEEHVERPRRGRRRRHQEQEQECTIS